MLKKAFRYTLTGIVSGLVITLFFGKNPIRTIPFCILNCITMIIYFVSVAVIIPASLSVFPRQQYKFRHLLVLLPALLLMTFLYLKVWNYIVQSIPGIQTSFTNDILFGISLISSVFIVTCIEGIDFFNYWKKYIVHSEQVEKANLLAQYEALRNQVNPHFLFNGLNTLISFIENNDNRAAPFAQNMADFLKYLLTHHKEELITLEEELSVVNQYVFLQNARFENDLTVTVKINNKLFQLYLPPLTLQMLIENAIKHNRVSSGNKLSVDIYDINNYIYVKNNKQLKNDVVSTGVGIKNIRGRYALFTNKDVIIEDTENYFTIAVPLLNNQTYEYTDN